MMPIWLYSFFTTIAVATAGAASGSDSSLCQKQKPRIFSVVAAACAITKPIIFEASQNNLYFASNDSITSLHLHRDKSLKSIPHVVVTFERPKDGISALAVDTQAKKFILASGTLVGEIELGDDTHVLDGSNEPEPDWFKPADSIQFYKQILPGHNSAIQLLHLTEDNKLVFSASEGKLCQWSPAARMLAAVKEIHASHVLALAVKDGALLSAQANGHVEILPLERSLDQVSAVFNGKEIRLATWDEQEHVLYAISHDHKLFRLDSRNLEVTHTSSLSFVEEGTPTALASKNHGVFVGDDCGRIRFYDVRNPKVQAGRITDAGGHQHELWYDRDKHNLISISEDLVKRYWMA